MSEKMAVIVFADAISEGHGMPCPYQAIFTMVY